MKRITILLFILLMTGSMMAEKFTLGKLTFQTISAKKVELVTVEKDITDLYLGSTITYNGVKYRIKSIGEEAFSGCKSLTSITIPNSVTSIEDGAFKRCKSLTSIIIPNSVKSIGRDAFAGCSSLTSIIVEKGNKIYDSRNNCNAIIETATNALIAGCYKTIIPNSVTRIGDWAFEGCEKLTSITIPSSVPYTAIGRNAFPKHTKIFRER